jgi:nitrogen fixation-related uncharacterized protein
MDNSPYNTDHHLVILRIYFVLSFFGSLIGFLALYRDFHLAMSPSSTAIIWKSSWILALTGLFAFLFLCLTILAFRRSTATRLIRFADRFLSTQAGMAVTFLIAFYAFLFSLIYSLSASPTIYGPVYSVWLVPFFLWLVWTSGLTLVYLVVLRLGFSRRVMLILFLGIAILVVGVGVSLQFWAYDSPRQEDIYFVYLDGERLLQGDNPYERVMAGDMHVNDKYSTYFPGFYYFAWATQKAGLRTFAEWLSFWRVISLLFNLSIAALLFYIPARKRLVGLSIFAALFWLFNRWTLHVVRTADIDFVAIFFMIMSLYLFQRNRIASYLLLGLSLTFKQIAVFLMPVYLIWSWKELPSNRMKHLISAGFWLGIIPLIASLPFLVWNWEAFTRSIMFSATRAAAAAFSVYSLDVALGWRGFLARIPILVMSVGVYWLTWRYDLGPYSIALLVLAVFVFFNSVFFTSYMVWLVALIPLTAYEIIAQSTNKIGEAPG